MKKVLFITYLFPPYGGSAIQRSSKFTKYLKDYGYNPVVLTTKVEKKKWLGGSYTIYNTDRSLLNDLEGIDLQIIRTKSSEPSLFFAILNKLHLNRLKKLLFIPDPMIFWVIPAIRAGIKIVREKKIDLIYTSAPPRSVNIIGLILSRMSKLPWIADFRDPGTDNFIEYWATRIHYLIDERLERASYTRAKKIVANTPLCKQSILRKNKQISPSKIHVITNGYDGQDFHQIAQERKNKKFTIAYVGRFYQEYKDDTERMNLRNMLSNILYYKISLVDHNSVTPYYLLKGINNLLNIYSEMKDEIKIKFIGPLSKKNKMLIKSFSLEDITEVTGYIEHNLCLEMMRKSDLLIYILGYSNQPLYTIAAKLYEYMASKIPILALVPEGDSKEYLKNSGLAFFAHPKNSDEIAQKIYSLHQQWKKGGITVSPNNEFIGQFERKKLTSELADVFDEVCKNKRS